MNSQEKVTIIAIGPLTNIAEALRREPDITRNARLVAMAGSVFGGLRDPHAAEPEYNVLLDTAAARLALGAAWDVLLVPLDSCGAVVLDGERYESLRSSVDPICKLILSSYREWEDAAVEPGVFDWVGYAPGMSRSRSTILFDTVAVYGAYSEALLRTETLPIQVGDDGTTTVVAGAPEIRVAVECDLPRFLDHLDGRLRNEAVTL
jgi:inosine-uridine nucleoside N-ribohydrolase